MQIKVPEKDIVLGKIFLLYRGSIKREKKVEVIVESYFNNPTFNEVKYDECLNWSHSNTDEEGEWIEKRSTQTLGSFLW